MSLFINGKVLASAHYLGVIVDQHLTWMDYVFKRVI